MRRQHSKRKLHKKLKPAFTAAYLAKWFRVVSNISAALAIIVCGTLVVLLLYQGMFYSTNFGPYTQEYWTPFHQSCRLSPAGFVPNSCHENEVNITTTKAWNTIGVELAKQLELTSVAYLTTCYISDENDGKWATVTILIAETAHASCNPKAPQVILGMAALDTVGTIEYPDGAYLLSTFSDARPIEKMDIVETMGNKVPVTKSVVKTIIDVDGTVTPTTWAQRNYVTNLNSLNRFFLMQVWVVAHFMDLSTMQDKGTGYSVGKTTGFITTVGWDSSHRVDNYILLLLFQIVICVVTLLLLSNDCVISFEGLSGLLKNKPVLTYDILASLERRKILLLCLVGTFLFSPLYADVVRYTYDINGHHYWSLTLLMVAIMMSLSWMALLMCMQFLPVPASWRNKPLSYMAPVFCYFNSFGFVVLEALQSRGPISASTFWSSSTTATLGITLNGTWYSAGAYTVDGTTPIIYILMPDVMACIAATWLLAILAHRIFSGRFTLDMAWTSHNDFVSQVPLPQYVTALDLDHKNTIAIGTKLYCKPSLMVLLGYCTVHDDAKFTLPADMHLEFSCRESSTIDTGYTGGESATSHHSSHHTKGSKVASTTQKSPHEAIHYKVLSIYDLLHAIVPFLRRVRPPHVFGEIHQNKFQLFRSNTRLEAEHKYVYSRGDCCG